MNEALLTIIKERPEKDEGLTACPHCGTEKVEQICHEQTCLGGDGKGSDPNHHWHTFRCPGCDKHFMRETKDGWQWYTEPGPLSTIAKGSKHPIVIAEHGSHRRVLRGVSACFEAYVYTCATCDGKVASEYRYLDGTPHRGRMVSYVDGKPQQSEWYVCCGCGQEVQTE